MDVRSHRCPLHLLLGVFIIGVIGAPVILVPQEPIQGEAGKSVLLPVTYLLPRPPATLRVIWSFNMSVVVFSEMTPCAGHLPPSKVCQDYSIVVEKYKQRAEFFPQNASLLLRDLRPEDSGVYTLTFQDLNETRSVILAVRDPGGPPSNTEFPQTPQPEADESIWRYLSHPGASRFMCAAIFLLVVLSMHLVWWRLAPSSAHLGCQ